MGDCIEDEEMPQPFVTPGIMAPGARELAPRSRFLPMVIGVTIVGVILIVGFVAVDHHGKVLSQGTVVSDYNDQAMSHELRAYAKVKKDDKKEENEEKEEKEEK